MCEPATIAMAMMAVTTVAQGYQAKQKGEFEYGVAKYNARQSENEAVRTRNKGTEEENRHREKTAQLLARQRAQLGAANVDLNVGSALNLQEDTELLGEVDALRIRSNYLDEAQVMDDQAVLTRAEGRNAKKAGNTAFKTSILKAAGTAIGGGLADKWFTASPGIDQVGMVGTGQEFAVFA